MTEKKIGGYQCEFVGPIPEDLVCQSCHLVAKKLHTTDCCVSQRFCQTCIEQALDDKKPCSNCSEVEFSTLIIKGAHKKTLALQVYCRLKKEGCEWVGELELIDTHLDTKCQYASVECTGKCGLKVQRRNLATHLEDSCPKRTCVCPYCNFTATFEVVSNTHWPKCSYYPVTCPNLCGVTCEREFINDHKQICSLEPIECELSYAGCKEKFLRQDHDEHIKQNMEKHLQLMATATLKISLENAAIQQELKKKDKEVKALKNTISQQRFLKLQLLQEKEEQHAKEVAALREDINQLRTVAGIPPYTMIMSNFKQLKSTDSVWTSECFHTHPQGYKCEIRVCPKGRGDGHNSHLSVALCTVQGEFDSTTLHWPAKVKITLQLLNQLNDIHHWTVTKHFEWNEGQIGGWVGNFSQIFIPHAELELNTHKQTQYLKNDCLHFRVSRVEIM